MKKYWIAFFSSLSLLCTAFIFRQSIKEVERQQTTALALSSLIPNSENLVTVAVKKSSTKARKLNRLYTKVSIDSLKLPSINDKFLKALE